MRSNLLFPHRSNLLFPHISFPFSLRLSKNSYYSEQDFSNDTSCSVTKVVDGDTIEIQCPGERPDHVRLIGINTPETVHPNRPVEPGGPEASNFTNNLLLGKRVYLRRDPYSQGIRGKQHRLLLYVFRASDGLFVNLQIVHQGHSPVYTEFPFTLKELFKSNSRNCHKCGAKLSYKRPIKYIVTNETGRVEALCFGCH